MNFNDTLRCVRLAAQAAEEKKAENITILDVRGQSSLADCFLYVSGTSHIHIRAIEDAIRHSLKDSGAALARTDGQRGHVWRALDYGSFIVHVMDEKTREFYAMERLWEKAKPIAYSDKPVPPIAIQKPALRKPKKVSAPIKKKSKKRPLLKKKPSKLKKRRRK